MNTNGQRDCLEYSIRVSKKKSLNCETCPGRKKGIFCDLEGSALTQLDREKNDNMYKKGQNLFLSGNPPFGLYCVHNGKVKVSKTNSEGKETIVRIVGAGGVLGHRSLLSNSPYKATATIIEDGKICFVSKQTIFDLMKVDPKLSYKVIEEVSTQMGAAEDKLASMAKKSVRERFAETLLLLAQGFGVKDGERIKIDVKLTREELGSLVGAASENVTRLIGEFKELKYIEQEEKNLFILNVDSIEAEASLGY